MAIKDFRWRRRARRAGHVDLGGSATLFSRQGDPMGSFLVEDLTSRGALLHGASRGCTEGARVHVMLALPSRAEPMTLWGDVGRIEAREADEVDFELRFRDLSADDEDLIEDAILDEWSQRAAS